MKKNKKRDNYSKYGIKNKGINMEGLRNTIENIVNDIRFQLSFSIVIIVLGVICTCISIINDDVKTQIEKPEGKDRVYEYLSKFSNYDSIIKPLSFNEFWPNESLIIKLKEKKISYWSGENLIAEVEYEKDSKKFSIVRLKSKKEDFAKFPKIENISSLVEESYKNEIKKIDLDEDERNLSLIYNALVGRKNSYIVLGKKIHDNDWKHFTSNDFPRYTLNITGYVYEHIDSVNNNAKNNPLLIEKYIDNISVQAVSYDYRNNNVYYGNTPKSASTTEERQDLPMDYLENKSVAGWFVDKDGEDDKLACVKNHYDLHSGNIFLDDSAYVKLRDLKWTEDINENKTTDYYLLFLKQLGYFLIIMGFVILVCILFSRLNFKTKEDDIDNGLKEDLDDKGLNNDKLFSEDKTNKLLDREKIIEEYKNSKEYKKSIEKIKNSVLEEYISSDEYKNSQVCRDKWQALENIENERDLVVILNKIREKNPKFPKIHTIDDIYPKQDSNIDAKVIKDILTNIDAINRNKSSLTGFYQNLCKKVEMSDKLQESYNKLNEKFTEIKDIIESYTKCKEYNIVKEDKDLKIWERMAIMLWSTKLVNDLLKCFGNKNIIAEKLEKAKQQHQEDVIQFFVTRLFMSYINNSSKQVDDFKIDSDNKVLEKQKNLLDLYDISIEDFSESYVKFISNLDSHYRKVKENDKYFNILKEKLVDKFAHNHDTIKDKGEYLSLLIALGYHIADYVEYINRTDSTIEFYPNVRYLLSNMDINVLDNPEFRHNDPAYSGNYTNRVYEWLKEVGVEHLQALVEDKLIIP